MVTLVLPLKGDWNYNPDRLKLTYEGREIGRTYFDARPSGIHRAVDIPTDYRQLLRAMDSGTIRRIGNEGSVGFGRYVMLSHRWPQSSDPHDLVHAHLWGTIEGVGAHVDEGDGIAYCDSTGNSTGNHVHLEWWWRTQDRTSSVDPYWLLCWIVDLRKGRKWHRNPYPAPSRASVRNRPLQLGEYGPRVLWLQWALRKNAIHGHLGKGTVRDIKTFQKRHDITPTGSVGVATRAKLIEIKRAA